jgi:hypothetical protein
MDSVSYRRAVMSGGLWFGVAYGLGMVLGANPDLYNTALDAGIMAGSAVGADVVHGLLGWNPTGITSALATGGMYAGIQKVVRGDSNYMVNVGFAGANDMLVEKWSALQQASARQQAMADADADE